MADIINLSTVAPIRTEWLWYPYIPLGKITILQGDPGEGKSMLALQIAAAVSRGAQFPDVTKTVTMADTVLYQNAEDGIADTIVPRLMQANAALPSLITINETDAPLSLCDPRLHQTILEQRPKLAVIDPIQGYLGDSIDMHRANEIRPVMSMLAATAQASGTAILLIGHMNKAYTAGKALYRGLGSIDITAAARSVLLLAKDPAQPENRVLMQLKNSLAPMGEPVAFRIREAGGMHYLGAYEITETALLNPLPEHRDSALARAKKLILAWMEQDETLPARDIYDLAQSENISRCTLFRARDELGVRTLRTKEGWVWQKPVRFGSVG